MKTCLDFVDDAEWLAAYRRSDGVCVPHALTAVELRSGTRELSALLELTLPKWEAVRADLERFVRKHEYRNRAAFTEAEARSYVRAYETMAGGQGLFGNDLHPGPPGGLR